MRGVSFDKALGRWKARYPGQKERTFVLEADAVACRQAWEAEHGVPRRGSGGHGSRPGERRGAAKGIVREGKGVRPGQYGGWIATGPLRAKRLFKTEAEALTQRAAWLEEFARTGTVTKEPAKRGRPAKGTGT